MGAKKKSKEQRGEELKLASLLNDLYELAERLGVEIVLNKMEDSDGGICKIKDKTFLYINQNLKATDRIDLIVREFRTLELSQIYLKPSLRKLIDEK